MTPHFILDYETFGQSALSAVVIECSYAIFDWDRFLDPNQPYKYKELLDLTKKDKLDVKLQVDKYRWKIEKDSLDWWMNQDKSVRKMLNPSSEDISIQQHIDNIISHIGNNRIKKWWSRSNTFDPIILARISEAEGRMRDIDRVLSFWQVRDTRTFIDTKFNFKNKKNSFIPFEDENKWNETFKHHDSRHDIVADILRMQAILRYENDLPSPE